MIRIAAKNPISYSQKDIKINGWAIESRIYAEDPIRNFLPSIGRLSRYSPPEELNGESIKLRNDSGVYEGAEISIHYDPLIAKLCVWADNRKKATKNMQNALDCFNIEGVQTNLNFLSSVLDNKKFESGDFSTAFISEEFPNGFKYIAPKQEVAKFLTIVAACMQEIQSSRMRESLLKDVAEYEKELKRIVVIGDATFEWNFKRLDTKTFIFNSDLDRKLEVVIRWTEGEQLVSAVIGSTRLKLKVRLKRDSFFFEYRGCRAKVQVFTPREAELARFMIERQPEDVSKLVLCPMPGLLVNLEVSIGEEVTEGQALCTIEAMKMENILRAEKNSTVKAINKEVGDSLCVDDAIIEFD
jgi:propionyl-CoA carboxylase alpha chain